jgi:hypothetical protein
MTGILLCCAALIVLLGALYIVLCHEPWLAAHLRSLLHREPADNPYALDPVDEHFTTAPRVVAGQDLDDSILIAELQAAYADYRAGVDIYAGARHEPSPEVKQ